MQETFAFAASLEDCTVETEINESFGGYRLQRSDRVVALAEAALSRCGYDVRTALSGGGTDGNVFNGRGVPCVTLSNGMTEIHTPDEHIAVADLDAMVDVTLALVDLALADAPRP